MMTKQSALKKILFIVEILSVITMVSCTYDLGEHDSKFKKVDTVVMDGKCEHVMLYDYAFNHTSNPTYLNGDYHYVKCAMYGADPLCDLDPQLEKHTRIDSQEGGTSETVRMYNGRLYREVNQVCTVCGQQAGIRYVLAA